MLKARPNVAPLRLADLREGESRRITYALSHYVQGAGPHVAAYAPTVTPSSATGPASAVPIPHSATSPRSGTTS